jgi:hypothetical protein
MAIKASISLNKVIIKKVAESDLAKKNQGTNRPRHKKRAVYWLLKKGWADSGGRPARRAGGGW